ncbi:hypothetical protein [Cytobacillus horneckiae]|uniref:Uncharacterized protein n=1 Tax=Cytobacillus horneckiae TaxID=549687 RepID=A0A2N0ZD73_9BACI|nr:hypothetical protein [Cytobacillus horneckiae]MEC1157190.1 hypothetical protein [Cytobacillus horneckiae]MED2938123.1 hypothetical protein [Cytobacillus horneckiae]PKG27460.1 hypothetical protein CWS20_18930 [Cytobacillus horneckiae]
MKRYQLRKNFKGEYKKGTKFNMITESEFIGVKEFVLRTEDFSERLVISESELNKYFNRIK